MGRRFFTSSLLLLSLAAFLFPLHAEEGGPTDQGIIPELKLFSKALGVIQEAYVGDVQPRQMLYSALSGILTSLDRHSQFIDPKLYELLQIHMRGEYAGIGIILQTLDNYPAVRAVKPGSAAEKAGLQVMDKILKVDGVTTEGLELGEVGHILRGEADTKVVLTIERISVKAPFDVEIIREKTEIESIQDIRMVTKKIGYMRIAGFSENTAEQVEKAVEELESKGLKKLILDFRNNDGGLLPEAVQLAELFLPKGKKVVSVESKIPEQEKEYFTSRDQKPYSHPIVILVNENTASASEIFSLCLRDHKRATIVGRKTFGKGSVQSVVPLDDVSAMKFTTARYRGPKGESIDEVGITPDDVIDIKNEPKGGPDPPLLRALEILN